MAEQYIGPYRVVREIGRGGMGEVFEAIHPKIERRVAIKVLHPQYAKNEQLVTRFFNEARAVNIVNHPSVVQISEFAQLPDGTAYIVMEYLEGESLGGRMKRLAGKLSLVETLRLCRQIAAALAAAHAKGIIHRDLKPDNVMIVSDPEAPGGERAKILDFGIAKLAAAANPAEGGEQVSQTRTGVMIGTPLYMAPEQCKGSGNIDDKADVYSLGIMLYRMLCGRPPFVGEGAGAVMAMHIYEAPTPLRQLDPGVPEDLAALVHRLLLKDPTQRPPMRQVMEELEQLKNLHTTGAINAAELMRLSGNMNLLTPTPTPAPLTNSGAHSIGQNQLVLSQQLGMSQISLMQTGHGQPAAAIGSNSVSQTLGSTAAQIAPEPRRRGVMVAVATLGSCALLGAALFGLVALRKPEPERDGRGERGATVAAVHKVRFVVSSEPSGATVLRASDQRELGQTPWQSEQAAGSGSLVLILRRAGYADKVVTVDQSANLVVKEALQPLIAASATASTPSAGVPSPAVRFVKKNGKRIAVAVKPPAAAGAVPSSPPPAAPAAPPSAAPVKPSSPPSKEESPHARIQMVD